MKKFINFNLFLIVALFLFSNNLSASIKKKLEKRREDTKESGKTKRSRLESDLDTENKGLSESESSDVEIISINKDKNFYLKLIRDVNNGERIEEALSYVNDLSNSVIGYEKNTAILIYKSLLKDEDFEKKYLSNALNIAKKLIIDQNPGVKSTAQKFVLMLAKEQYPVGDLLSEKLFDINNYFELLEIYLHAIPNDMKLNQVKKIRDLIEQNQNRVKGFIAKIDKEIEKRELQNEKIEKELNITKKVSRP